MAKTLKERQAEYRLRVGIKIDAFEETDRLRRQRIDSQSIDGPYPEARVIREYFKAHPLCFNLPEAVRLTKDQIWVKLRPTDWEVTSYEAAACVLAFRRMSSMEVCCSLPTGPSGAQRAMRAKQEIEDRVREVEDDMRSVGMWGAE